MNAQERRDALAQVRELMEARGWSQIRLAAESGHSENTVGDFLKGKRNTQPSKIRDMLNALGSTASVGGHLVLDDVPGDVRVFVNEVVLRTRNLSESARDKAFARLYPLLLASIDAAEKLDETANALAVGPSVEPRPDMRPEGQASRGRTRG